MRRYSDFSNWVTQWLGALGVASPSTDMVLAMMVVIVTMTIVLLNEMDCYVGWFVGSHRDNSMLDSYDRSIVALVLYLTCCHSPRKWNAVLAVSAL
mmetsp:Transcript_19759/g.33890  ORF Transcript_19759/g.33890 Transcript_19759/m.33890 type:complete len:96 (-) Transcript_19759:324-611(-)